ncbi:MAG: PDZ domain-containing protein [Saprospiraceae bacterium]
MKKFISNLVVLFTLVSFCQAQNGEKLETWAENLALKVERLAERFSQNAEESFVELSDIAEELADDIEEKFDDGDFDIRLKGSEKNWKHQSQDVGYLGIHSDHISKEKADRLGFKNKFGSYVTKVVKNSAAEKAGLQLFDYIYGVEDQRTSDNQDLTDILSDYDSGESVTIYFIRNGKEKSATVKLGDYNDFNWEDEEEGHAFLGVRPAANERSRDMDGVTVQVIEGSAAADMGLQNSDIIIAIDGYPILDFDDVGTAIDNHQPGDNVEVLVKRGDQEITKKGILKDQKRQQKVIVYKDDNNGWNQEETEKWSAVKGAFLVYI